MIPYYYEDFGGVSVVNNIDIEFLNKYAEEYYEKSFLVCGRNIEKTNELLVSTRFSNSLGIDAKEMLNKTISITSGSRSYNEIDNMTIVGVYNPLTEYDSSHSLTYSNYCFGDGFIVKEDSIRLLKKERIGGLTTYVKDEDNFSGFYVESYVDESQDKVLFFNNFEASRKAYDYINKNYSISQIHNCIKFNSNYSDYVNFHDSIVDITVFLSVISIAIVLISILNMFDVIGYNVVKKRNNVGMMKALGLKDKESFKLYLSEFTLYIIISGFVSIFISFVFSAIFTILTNLKMNFVSLEFNIGTAINFWYYFLALCIVIGVIYLIAYLYILIVTKRLVKNKPVTLLK